MLIDPLTQSLAPRAEAQPSPPWRVGQVLHALVMDAGIEGLVRLQIGGQRLQARTDAPVSPGQALVLEVVSLDDPPLLRTLEDAPPTPEAYTRLLRYALPRQEPLGPLLANLALIEGDGDLAASLLPKPIIEAARALFAQLAAADEVTHGAGLKQAWLDSGIFFEARLAQNILSEASSLPSADFKGGLLRLASLLAPWLGRAASPNPPPGDPTAAAPASLRLQHSPEQALAELARQVDASLARLDLSQLNSLSTPAPQWVMELPVRHQGETTVFQLHVEEEPDRSQRGSDKCWAVSLAFEMQGLGAIYARLSLAGRTLGASLWAERSETWRLLEAHVQQLREGFSRAQLQVADIHCFHGTPAPARRAAPPAVVDIRV